MYLCLPVCKMGVRLGASLLPFAVGTDTPDMDPQPCVPALDQGPGPASDLPQGSSCTLTTSDPVVALGWFWESCCLCLEMLSICETEVYNQWQVCHSPSRENTQQDGKTHTGETHCRHSNPASHFKHVYPTVPVTL